MRATPRVDLSWLLALLLTVLAVAPLTYPGFYQAHSGFMPAFDAVQAAHGPAWAGVPDPVRGEGRLAYLLVWPILKLSGSGVAAVKWGYGLAFVLGAAAVYGWTRRRLEPHGALVAAVVYTYLPWHLSAVYVRGAYAEAWLWAFWPLLAWATDRLTGRRPILAALVALLALAASLWVQPGLTVLILPIALLPVAWRRWGWAAPWLALAVLVIGAAPLILASPAARVSFGQHFLYPYQLLSAASGLGPSVPGWQDGMSFQIGWPALALATAALALAAPGRAGGSEPGVSRRVAWGWAAVLAVMLLSTLGIAAPLWRATRLDSLLTYPWQVLALAGLPLAFLAGAAVRADSRRGLAAAPALAALAALAILAGTPYLVPRFTRVDPGAEPVAVFRPAGPAAAPILLLREQVSPPVEITPTLALTLTWQVVQPAESDYTVFVHLLAPDGSKVAQRDSRPCDGACSTRTWQPGQIVVDTHRLALSADAPPPPYRLAVGLYVLETGERLAVAGRGDQTVYLDVP